MKKNNRKCRNYNFAFYSSGKLKFNDKIRDFSFFLSKLSNSHHLHKCCKVIFLKIKHCLCMRLPSFNVNNNATFFHFELGFYMQRKEFRLFFELCQNKTETKPNRKF